MNNNQHDIDSLIRLTQGGLSIATYPEIKEVLANRYREIYGSDIDLANTTSDGIFLENMCLILSNTLQAFKLLYDNTDIRTATGKFLESLCALTGIYRKGPTQSVAYMKIKNLSNTQLTINSSNQISFLDNAGLIWTTGVGDINHSSASATIVLNQDEEISLPVYCELYGPVQAKKGWINELVTNNINIEFEQLDNASYGSYEENDTQLKQRRNQSISSAGLTVLSNLKGALLNIYGIKEVKIYNNNTDDSIIALDNTIVNSGCVYIITRQTQNVADYLIGDVIYEKMTPGIKTTKSSEVNGTNHEYVYEELNSLYTNKVNWKEASKITSDLTITISLVKYNTFNENEIQDELISFLNNLEMGQEFTDYELMNDLVTNDFSINNKRTFLLNNITLTSNDLIITSGDFTSYKLRDTFFDLSSDNCTITSTDTTLTLTFGD